VAAEKIDDVLTTALDTMPGKEKNSGNQDS